MSHVVFTKAPCGIVISAESPDEGLYLFIILAGNPRIWRAPSGSRWYAPGWVWTLSRTVWVWPSPRTVWPTPTGSARYAPAPQTNLHFTNTRLINCCCDGVKVVLVTSLSFLPSTDMHATMLLWSLLSVEKATLHYFPPELRDHTSREATLRHHKSNP